VKCLEDIEARDGQEVMLFCAVTGHPMPTITWYHNNKNIVKNEEYVFTYDRQTGHIYLVILDCLSDDEGEFRCVASNAAGTAATQCRLRILAAGSSSPVGRPLSVNASSLKHDGTDIFSRTSREPKPAVSRSVPDDASAAANGHAASASESLTLMPPDILFHTKMIPGQSKKVASYRTVLRRASDNDLLGYQAKSAGDLHRQNALWKVADWSVYSKGTVQPAESSLNVVSPTQARVRSETKLSLQFQTGVPSSRTAINTESFLPVGDTSTCYGAKSSSSHSRPSKVPYVKAAVKTTAPSEFSSRLFEPPRFLLPLSNQSVRDGDATTLRVCFHGNPTPKLHWFFNEKAVDSEEDFVIRTDSVKGESMLWIKEVFPEDDGEFVCKAENDYGTAVTHCRLTVHCKRSSVYFVADFTGKFDLFFVRCHQLLLCR